MAEVTVFEPGGYRYINAAFQYSSGVAALPGFTIERARFARPLPLAEGFAAAEAHLQALGRPLTAFCACELRSPEPFTDQGFTAFNRIYVGTLDRWGLYRDGDNPVARTNVCTEYDKVAVPSIYAFSYTISNDSTQKSFVISGGGEVHEGGSDFQNRIVRAGDTSPDGLREKVQFVMGIMEQRLTTLGYGWSDVQITQTYTVHDIGALVGPEIAARGATNGGLTWHFCRPPVINIEYEMDVRGAIRELILG